MPLARNKLSVVHVAKKQPALDDETYRALLSRIAGVRVGFNPAITILIGSE